MTFKVWITDSEKRWLKERERDARVEAGATAIYEDLWKEVLSNVNEVKSTVERFSGLTTNGLQLAHIISFPVDQSSDGIGAPPAIEIRLIKDEHQIVVSGNIDAIYFDIDICTRGGEVCLKLDEKKISYEEASRRVLTAFLYPGLPYQEPAVIGRSTYSLPRRAKPSDGLKRF